MNIIEERLKQNQTINFQQTIAEAQKKASTKSNTWPSLPKEGGIKPISDDALAIS
jgi:hypothetical protein